MKALALAMLLAGHAQAAGTTIWNATDSAPAAGTDRIPVAMSAVSGPSYLTVDALNAYVWGAILDPELACIAALTSAADRVPYFTGSGTCALATFTSAGRALVDDASAAAQLVTLGVPFLPAESTSSPNNTIYVDSLTAGGSTTDVDIAIVPKRYGAIMVNIPDGTTTGGDKRGLMAVDLQGLAGRSASTQVASGQSAFVVGERNTAGNTASVAMGYSNTVSAQKSVALGVSNLVSGGGSGQIAAGTFVYVPGDRAVGIGYDLTASGDYSLGLGVNADTRSVTGSRAFGSSYRAANGDTQVFDAVQRVTTTNATETTTTNGGGAASTTNILVMPNNSATTCTANVVAMTGSAATVASWSIKVTGKRVANAASTALVGASTITTLGQDAGAATWVADIKADTTNGGLVTRVTGQAATTIYWVSHMSCVQVQ